MLKNVTTLQWIGIIILFNSTLLGGASQLADLALSVVVVKAILAVATLGNGFLGGLVTMFGGQAAQLKTVAELPGVESIKVNAKANASLAQSAVSDDVALAKVSPTTEAASAVTAIAKAAS